MKLFEPDTRLTSFKYPILKLIIVLLVFAFVFSTALKLRLPNEWVTWVLRIVCAQIIILCVLAIYISVGEIFIVFENRNKRKKKKHSSLDAKHLTIETISRIVSENDIIEIEVSISDEIIKIGASADCKHSSSVFENKLFYISNSEFKTIELFKEALVDLFPEGVILVLKIDDLSLKNWKI